MRRQLASRTPHGAIIRAAMEMRAAPVRGSRAGLGLSENPQQDNGHAENHAGEVEQDSEHEHSRRSPDQTATGRNAMTLSAPLSATMAQNSAQSSIIRRRFSKRSPRR